jgi:AraC family transcriptional regulator
MISFDDSLSIHFELKNIAFLRFLKQEEYSDIVSPYSRMYLITRGRGQVSSGNQTFELEAGFIYLFPGFVHHSYIFDPDLEHVYVHFRSEMENGLSIFNLISIKNKIPATDLNKLLFYRLLELNPGLELVHHDPKVYQEKPWMNKKPSYCSPGPGLETQAIIQQLFSGFIKCSSKTSQTTYLKFNFHDILRYIQQNLHNDIKIDQLAEISCLSNDHFSRVFKSVFGVPPYEFIVRKRIEKSQFLLLSTEHTISQIIEETNFKNAQYFSRMFKKYTSYTPAKYRNMEQLAV